jgi:hypothetical protein
MMSLVRDYGSLAQSEFTWSLGEWAMNNQESWKGPVANRSNPTRAYCSCTSRHLETFQDGDSFFMQCSSCGKRGQEASSLYEAQVAWDRSNGRGALGMWDMMLVIALGLCLVGVGFLILNSLIG